MNGPKNTKVEQDIDYRRVAWEKIYDDFRNELTDEEGVQDSNLTPKETRGLKKLRKRVQDGQLVVVKTDKSGKFCLMSMEEYRRAGQ